jgi:hypothetical protein
VFAATKRPREGGESKLSWLILRYYRAFALDDNNTDPGKKGENKRKKRLVEGGKEVSKLCS